MPLDESRASALNIDDEQDEEEACHEEVIGFESEVDL